MLRPYGVESVTNSGRYLGRPSTRFRQQVWYSLVVGKTKTKTKRKMMKTKTKLKLNNNWKTKTKTKNKSKRKSHWYQLCDSGLILLFNMIVSSIYELLLQLHIICILSDVTARSQVVRIFDMFYQPWVRVFVDARGTQYDIMKPKFTDGRRLFRSVCAMQCFAYQTTWRTVLCCIV